MPVRAALTENFSARLRYVINFLNLVLVGAILT